MEVTRIGIIFCNDDNIVSLGEMFLIKPEEFPKQSLNSVPFYRIPCFFANRYPPSRYAQLIFLENDNEISCMVSFARSILIDKILSIQ